MFSAGMPTMSVSLRRRFVEKPVNRIDGDEQRKNLPVISPERVIGEQKEDQQKHADRFVNLRWVQTERARYERANGLLLPAAIDRRVSAIVRRVARC